MVKIEDINGIKSNNKIIDWIKLNWIKVNEKITPISSKSIWILSIKKYNFDSKIETKISKCNLSLKKLGFHRSHISKNWIYNYDTLTQKTYISKMLPAELSALWINHRAVASKAPRQLAWEQQLWS